MLRKQLKRTERNDFTSCNYRPIRRYCETTAFFGSYNRRFILQCGLLSPGLRVGWKHGRCFLPACQADPDPLGSRPTPHPRLPTSALRCPLPSGVSRHRPIARRTPLLVVRPSHSFTSSVAYFLRSDTSLSSPRVSAPSVPATSAIAVAVRWRWLCSRGIRRGALRRAGSPRALDARGLFWPS